MILKIISRFLKICIESLINLFLIYFLVGFLGFLSGFLKDSQRILIKMKGIVEKRFFRIVEIVGVTIDIFFRILHFLDSF